MALFAFATLEAHRYRKQVPRGYYYLLVFVLFSCVWFYVDTDIAGASYLGSVGLMLLNLYSYLLLPVPFLLFVGCMQPSIKRVTMVLNTLLTANILVQTALLLAGRLALGVALSVSHALLGLSICVLLVLLHDRRRLRFSVRDELSLGVTIAAVAGLLTTIIFYVFPNEDNASVFRYGVIVLVITLTISVLRSNVDILMQARNIEELRIHEEEYRIAVRQSDKHVLRFDVDRRALTQGEKKSPCLAGRPKYSTCPSPPSRRAWSLRKVWRISARFSRICSSASLPDRSPPACATPTAAFRGIALITP